MSETIGQKLRRAREAKRLSLEQASAATRIRPYYIEALERDDLSAIPSAAQARGFLRIYADFLGVRADELIPAARPVEPAAASIPNVQAAPVQPTIPSPAPEHPNLLANLRERFSRRTAPAEIPAPTPEPVIEESPAPPEPEPFMPARYTEELPAEPQPVVEEPAKEITRPAVKRSSTRKPAAKKPAPKKEKTTPRSKTAKSSAVKKKLTNSRPKKKASRTKRG